MIDCNKAGQLIEQKDFEKLSWIERRKLRLHLKVCGICAKYEEENLVLKKIIKFASAKYCNKCLSAEEKQQIKDRMAGHLE